MATEKVCVCNDCGMDCPCRINPDPTEVKDTWLWIKDSRGFGSVTVTFLTIAFFVTTIAYVASIVESVGGLAVRPFDVAACSAYFIPILTLYFGRKATEAKFAADVIKKAGKPDDAAPKDGEGS